MLSDPLACRIVDCIDYDFSQVPKADRSSVGVCIRVRHFDRQVAAFFNRHHGFILAGWHQND